MSAKQLKKGELKEPTADVEEVLPITGDISDSGSESEQKVQDLATTIDSDEEAVGARGLLFEPGQDVGTIPKMAQEAKKKADFEASESAVVYIGRIPHGFYEYEMRQYFSQFGPINKLRLSRNKKTGASKHFAFVEFADSDTAEIVAKTMNNYLLFGHILKCKTIPKEQIHEDLFKGANRRFKKVPWNKLVGKALEKPLTESAWEKKLSRERSKRAKQASKLEGMGYTFESPPLKDVPSPRVVLHEDREIKSIAAPPVDGTEVQTQETEMATKEAVKVAAQEPKTEVSATSASTTKAPKSKKKSGRSEKK